MQSPLMIMSTQVQKKVQKTVIIDQVEGNSLCFPCSNFEHHKKDNYEKKKSWKRQVSRAFTHPGLHTSVLKVYALKT